MHKKIVGLANLEKVSSFFAGASRIDPNTAYQELLKAFTNLGLSEANKEELIKVASVNPIDLSRLSSEALIAAVLFGIVIIQN